MLRILVLTFESAFEAVWEDDLMTCSAPSRTRAIKQNLRMRIMYRSGLTHASFAHVQQLGMPPYREVMMMNGGFSDDFYL